MPSSKAGGRGVVEIPLAKLIKGGHLQKEGARENEKGFLKIGTIIFAWQCCCEYSMRYSILYSV